MISIQIFSNALCAAIAALFFVCQAGAVGLVSRDVGHSPALSLRPVVDLVAAGIVPGVFGSHAIPVNSFPAAKRWADVYSRISECAADGQCAEGSMRDITKSSAGLSFAAKLRLVNTQVNALLRYGSDRSVYGAFDHWAAPAESLARRAGDCEDFAILKMAALKSMGIPAASMSLVVVQVRRRNAFHAVLSVNTSNGVFILDNVSDAVRLDNQVTDYLPLLSFSTNRTWIHGTKSGRVQIAGAMLPFSRIAPGEPADRLPR